MSKSNNIGLIRYEFIAYVPVFDTQNVNEILLTKDDFADMKSQSDQIDWVPVENLDIDIIDNGEIDINSIVKTKKRICGLFDAEPLDWEYARIIMILQKQNIVTQYPGCQRIQQFQYFLMLRIDLYILDSLIFGL